MVSRMVAMAVAFACAAACGGAGKGPLLSTDGSIGVDGIERGPDGREVVGEPEVKPAEAMVADVAPADLDLSVEVGLPDTVEPEEVSPPDVGVVELPPEPDLVEMADEAPQPLTCGDIWQCGLELGCTQPQSECWQGCMVGASELAVAEFEALADCFVASCAELPQEDQGDCLWEHCGNQVMNCVGGAGTADCYTTLICVQSCAPEDGNCLMSCLAQADEQAIAVVLAMSGATEGEAFVLLIGCVGGHGEATCGEAVKCATTCENEPTDPPEPGPDPGFTCVVDCLSQTSEQGAADLLAFLDCAAEQCPDGMDECPALMLCVSKCPDLF